VDDLFDLLHFAELLHYDPVTGIFTWRKTVNSRALIGQVAGNVDCTDGYRKIRVAGKLLRAHRLAWLFCKGGWPDDEVDHINHRRDDNRLLNLRAATSAQNMQNLSGPTARNTTGLLGVVYRDGRYRAEFVVNRQRYGRTFETIFDAAAWIIPTRRALTAR
jgi:hypothetical protein